MPRPSRRRVQCPDPNCQAIKSTRGNHYFVCDKCRKTWDIEPNLFDQTDKNSKLEHDYDTQQGQDSGQVNGQNRDSTDMGETGNPQTDSDKDGQRGHSDRMEKEPNKSGEELELV